MGGCSRHSSVTFHVGVCENCRLVALDGRIGEDALVTISKSHSRFLADTFPISWFRKKDYQLAPSQRAGAGDYMEPASQHLWVQRTLKEVENIVEDKLKTKLAAGRPASHRRDIPGIAWRKYAVIFTAGLDASKARENWQEDEMRSFRDTFINGFMDNVLSAHTSLRYDSVETTWPCFIKALAVRKRQAEDLEAEQVRDIIRSKREALEQEDLEEQEKATAGVRNRSELRRAVLQATNASLCEKVVFYTDLNVLCGELLEGAMSLTDAPPVLKTILGSGAGPSLLQLCG
ncbi:unnamed protein product [Symbiodinium pilosum]|uniref:Uncharacterized protein n=1 Tax=Symbiodinium pilosum TaxID=2952 RepID=A0A812NAR9_SYMPI|nr:unnamed protein product [Symbiodinium pilosum]